MSKFALSMLCGIGFAVVGAQAFAETAPPAKPGVVAPRPAPTPAPTPAPSGTPGTPSSVGNKKVRFVTGTANWTLVSGYSGEGLAERAGPAEADLTVALSGLESGEFYDEPLAIRVYGKRLDTAAAVENDDLFTIGRVFNAGRDKKISFSERRFVRGVALCTGGEKDTKERKMKGIKLFYATVSTAGVVDADDKTGTSWERPNCKVWHPGRFCGPEKVARAAKFHRDKGSDFYQGVELECMTPSLN